MTGRKSSALDMQRGDHKKKPNVLLYSRTILRFALQNIFLHSILAHTSVDVDMGFLTDPVRARHHLQIVLGVPTALGRCTACERLKMHGAFAVTHIEYYDGVGGLQINTKTTCTCG